MTTPSFGAVDTQVHLHGLVPPDKRADHGLVVEAAVAAMNAVGVDIVLIDEAFGVAPDGLNTLPGHRADNGAWRSDHPLSEVAVAMYPDRFGYMTRVDPADPDLDDVVARLRATPGAAAIRISGHDPAFAAGGYAPLFAAAEAHGMPVLVFLMFSDDPLGELRPYLERFHEIPIGLDHAGLDHPKRDETGWSLEAALEPILGLAIYPNLLIKWEHAERISAEPYPFADVVRSLRSVIEAFGATRVTWASDVTMASDPATPYRQSCTWAEALQYLASSELLTAAEKERILGGTAREIFRL